MKIKHNSFKKRKERNLTEIVWGFTFFFFFFILKKSLPLPGF